MVFDVLEVAVKIPKKAAEMRITRVLILSGLLTFMYCVEFGIGIRTVYYTFKIWSEPPIHSPDKRTCWTLCVSGLLIATVTTVTINVLSAIWEQKQLEEKGKDKSMVRFVAHVIIGGMIWRYLNLWCVGCKKYQKKSALLLTMTKFFFTQTFTIPLVIVHVSVAENLGEIVFDVVSIFSISLNLVLTCTMFSWCAKEVEDLKKWDFETIDLIPMLFQMDPTVTTASIPKVPNDPSSKEAQKTEKKESRCASACEEITIKTIVLCQSFGFSLGRLLALGILLKLAGIYAVSIMFLQLLISVIYLKFQAPILVSDSLPKWRQLTRLAFMSYILIFEWHLNREPKTAYDFSFNMKHNILYYCVATVESVFYLVTWTVTTSYITKSANPTVKREQNYFCRIILVIGSLALVFSLSIHILLLFWRSRKISKLFYSFRRRYETTKLNLSKYGFRGEKEKAQGKNLKRPQTPISHIDISHPIPIQRTPSPCRRQQTDLEKQTSYRDLREPVDDEIEIYFRKCERGRNRDSRSYNGSRNASPNPRRKDMPNERTPIKTIDTVLRQEVNNQRNAANTYGRRDNPAIITPTITYDTVTKSERGTHAGNSFKSKMNLFSDSFNEQWEKMSKKISGKMKDKIQTKKDKFDSFRYDLSHTITNIPEKAKSVLSSPSTNRFSGSSAKTPADNPDTAEGYFVGDERCYQVESLPCSDPAIDSKRLKFAGEATTQIKSFARKIDEDAASNSDIPHNKDGSPCPCYICKNVGEDTLRRRSSSVPPSDPQTKESEEKKGTNQTFSRYLSIPNISQNRCENENQKDRDSEKISMSPKYGGSGEISRSPKYRAPEHISKSPKFRDSEQISRSPKFRDSDQISRSPKFRDEQIPKSPRFRDEQMPKSPRFRDEQIPKSPTFRDEQMPKSPTFRDEKMPRSPKFRDEQISRSPNFRDQISRSPKFRDEQMSKSPTFRNEQMPKSPTFRDEKMPRSPKFRDEQIPRSPKFGDSQQISRSPKFRDSEEISRSPKSRDSEKICRSPKARAPRAPRGFNISQLSSNNRVEHYV